MGKAGAYLEHDRVAHGEREALEAIEDFKEFALPLSEEEQQVQASRCMMCGVAFCQAGYSFGKARPSRLPAAQPNSRMERFGVSRFVG